MYDFIVCGLFKNEAHILNEWIEHYIARGVDHIFLINDFSTDNFLPIIDKHKNNVTLFNNDIITKNIDRQTIIYEKYLRSVISTSTWAAILDLDEFLYSPTGLSFKDILENNSSISQIKVDWLHFGSNGHIDQPVSVVRGFTKRAPYTTREMYSSYKTIFKTADLISFGIHMHNVSGSTVYMQYSEDIPSDLVINHYNIQSKNWYLQVKGTRGDVNNWLDHIGLARNIDLFNKYDINIVEDNRLLEQNSGIYKLI